MKKLIAESLEEYRNSKKVETEKVDEGAFDFFSGPRALVANAIKAATDVAKADNALKAAFANQFSSHPKIKQQVLAWSIEQKQDILKKAAEAYKDSKVGILTIMKDAQGQIIVKGSPVQGGAGHSVTGK